MTERTRPMPTGRVRRTAKVGGLVGSEVVRAYANKAANLVRTDEDRSAADARRRLDGARHAVGSSKTSTIDSAICLPSSNPMPPPRPRSGRSTAPVCTTAAKSRSRCSTRTLPALCAPIYRTLG